MFNVVINFAVMVLKDVKCLFYADDAKFMLPIRSTHDCVTLQNAATRFVELCKLFGFELVKCKTMTITKSRMQINYSYQLDDTILERVNKFNDLGIIYNDKFNFNDDFSTRIAKARSMLGFIKRQTADFKDESVLKILYMSFVRSNLEYSSPVWSPYHIGWIRKFEKVQCRFMKFIIRNQPNDQRFNYLDMCIRMNLPPLLLRRKLASIMTCYDLLTNKIDCPDLLENLNVNCPVRQLRNNELFKLVHHSRDYAVHEPLNEMMANFNDVSHLFDFDMQEALKRYKFKSEAMYILKSAIPDRELGLYTSLGS